MDNLSLQEVSIIQFPFFLLLTLPLMAPLLSHLNVLERAAERFPDRPVFKLGQRSSTSDAIDVWIPITFREFQRDVELSARYWNRKLSSSGIPSRSVVGLW